jgi:hypothetical protein
MSPEVNGKTSPQEPLPSNTSGLHLELSQLEFLTRYPNSKMGVLAPWRRFIFDKNARKGFYDFIRSVKKESQKLGSHTDERQIVNADIERQLNEIFNGRCIIKICNPEDHNLLLLSKQDDRNQTSSAGKKDAYSVAMLDSSTSSVPTVYISELLLRSQDGDIQTKLHYQTALCEMVVGLILCREKIEKYPNKLSSKIVKALCKQLLTREKKDDYENRCAVVMYTFSRSNFISFLKNPNTLTWIPSLESIVRGGKSSISEAQAFGYSVAKSWPDVPQNIKDQFSDSFKLLVELSELQYKSSPTWGDIQIRDEDLRVGAVAAKYVAQFSGLANPVQTCEAAIYSAFPLENIKTLRSIYNINISPRAEALLSAFQTLKSTSFDIAPKLETDKANHVLDYQQALLMQKCVELSNSESNDRKFHPSDLLALYFSAKAAELGTISDKASKNTYAQDLDREARFTLLPLMERLNVNLFKEVGYLLLRAFDPELTSRIKHRVSLQCAGLNLGQRKRFLGDILSIAKLAVPLRTFNPALTSQIKNRASLEYDGLDVDQKNEFLDNILNAAELALERYEGASPDIREKTYYSLSDKHDESVEFVRSFARDFKIRDIDKILNHKIPAEIQRLSGSANNLVDSAVNEIVESLYKQATANIDPNDQSQLNTLNKTRFELYKHVFSLIRNTDNLGIRLISPNPGQAIEDFFQLLSVFAENKKYDIVEVKKIDKPEGMRVNLDGDWVISRYEVKIEDKLEHSYYLEIEVHAMTESVYTNQKSGLGLFKYAFAHWVMKARRSVCRYNKIDESSFPTYAGVIPLQKDPIPTSVLNFYEHFDLLWGSLSELGSYHRVGDQVISIPSWDSNPSEAVKATKVYRDNFANDPISQDSTSVYAQIGYFANAKLKNFQNDFGEFTPTEVEELLFEEALSRIADYKVPGQSYKTLSNDFVTWFKRYYTNIFGLYPSEVCAAFLDDTIINDAEGNSRKVSQIMMSDLLDRAKHFFAISNVGIQVVSDAETDLLIDANADLMGYHKSLFSLRKQLAEQLGMPVPPIKELRDRSTSSDFPNSQTIKFGSHPDITQEQYSLFLEEYKKQIELNFLPLNAKNTKKSAHSHRIQISALDTQDTLLHLYELAEKYGISIDHNQATTGVGNEEGIPLARFDMSLRAILKDRDMNEDSSENTQKVRERIADFVKALREVESPELQRKIFRL